MRGGVDPEDRPEDRGGVDASEALFVDAVHITYIHIAYGEP